MTDCFRFSVPTRIAVQADPLESLRPNGDSTLLLMDAAVRAGAELLFYTPETMALDDNGHVSAKGAQVFKAADGTFSCITEASSIDFSTCDYVVMRQDPPFDMRYITYARMLERLPKNCYVLNNPASVCAFSEKITPTLFPQFTPPTLISEDVGAIREFLHQHHRIVLKPLYDCAGQGIIRLSVETDKDAGFITAYLKEQHAPCVAQVYLPDITETGDFRAVMIDGEYVGGFARMPPKDGFICNLAAGGSAMFRERSTREIEICNALGPILRDNGLFLTGLDIVGGYLTEINVTSPTGLYHITHNTGNDVAMTFWEKADLKYRPTVVKGVQKELMRV